MTTNTTPSLQARVVEVIRETADAHSLVLEAAEGSRGRLDYKPGQFLTLRIPSERTGGVARCYSMCSSPLQDDHLKITVKRTRNGYGSNWICDNVTEGHVFDVLRPVGTFVPHSLDADFLLIAGGSGVTPVMSILSSALTTGAGKVTLIYANRDEDSVIFRDELIALSKAHPGRLTVIHWLETVQGIPDHAGMQALAAPYVDREAFICGPEAFMECSQQALHSLGMPHDRVHVEHFNSLETDPFAHPETLVEDPSEDSAAIDVELDGQNHTVPWPQGNRLLDVLLNAGLDAPFSCREGACSACTCMLLEGEVRMENNEVLDSTDLSDGLILACQSVQVSERVKITYDA